MISKIATIRKKIKSKVFNFKPFSIKQKKILTWWCDKSPYKNYNGIIADGAIRSGKTVSMALSFIFWSWSTFSEYNFAMCGKTIGSFKRNVWLWLNLILKFRGFKVKKCTEIGQNIYFIHKNNRGNYYYIFGGKDESSQDLIQGITLAGVLFDEVALMPESFVNQATGRCSVEGSKFWFNCNPDGPYHYFKIEWIDKVVEKKILYLHFTMDDNLSLSEQIKERYRSMFTGVFFKRYILGLWVVAEGIIYDMFSKETHCIDTSEMKFTKYYLSCDYGVYNALSFGLWGYNPKDKIWYRIKEFYYSGRHEGKRKDNEEYYKILVDLVGDRHILAIIIDPSASSFIETIKKYGKFKVKKANNDLNKGIENTGTALNLKRIMFDLSCINSIKEFYSYVWNDKLSDKGKEEPIKINDHAMDDIRYFVNTILFKKNGSLYDLVA